MSIESPDKQCKTANSSGSIPDLNHKFSEEQNEARKRLFSSSDVQTNKQVDTATTLNPFSSTLSDTRHLFSNTDKKPEENDQFTATNINAKEFNPTSKPFIPTHSSDCSTTFSGAVENLNFDASTFSSATWKHYGKEFIPENHTKPANDFSKMASQDKTSNPLFTQQNLEVQAPPFRFDNDENRSEFVQSDQRNQSVTY